MIISYTDNTLTSIVECFKLKTLSTSIIFNALLNCFWIYDDRLPKLVGRSLEFKSWT